MHKTQVKKKRIKTQKRYSLIQKVKHSSCSFLSAKARQPSMADCEGGIHWAKVWWMSNPTALQLSYCNKALELIGWWLLSDNWWGFSDPQSYTPSRQVLSTNPPLSSHTFYSRGQQLMGLSWPHYILFSGLPLGCAISGYVTKTQRYSMLPTPHLTPESYCNTSHVCRVIHVILRLESTHFGYSTDKLWREAHGFKDLGTTPCCSLSKSQHSSLHEDI